MERFNNWISEKGIITDAVVKETEYAGYGLFATKDIPSGTTVVHIPNDLIFTSLNVMQKNESFSTAINDYFAKKYNVDAKEKLEILTLTHEKFVLSLFLLYCRSFETEYQPYIDILPTISFFKENHILYNLDSIKGTSLEISTRAKLASLQRDLQELQQLDQQHTNWITDISLEDYIWADCVFWSRVVGIGESEREDVQPNLALIPYFDFANHSHTQPTIRWQLLPDQQGLDLVTYDQNQSSVTKDTELLLSYGSKPNQELLFLHGFCIPNNPEPSCFTLSVIPFLDPASDMPKIQWLQQIGGKPTLKLFNRTVTEGGDDLIRCGWTHESVAIMYLVVMDEDSGLSFSVDDEEGNINGLFVGNKEVASLNEIEKVVNEMELLPVLKLRVTMLLSEALEYHYTNITQQYDNDSPIARQVLIYREEETYTLESAIEDMMKLRDTLMNDPVVVSYLKDMEE